ncbi:MAG: DUF2249 domain-containing protein [Propionibacteriales bacterium]|nr:DUF2249 domain-containing protein [Propionibacteriales bacterium]
MPQSAPEVRALDVRTMSRPERHSIIFASFDELPVGGALDLTSDHEPRPLRQEFEADHPGGHDWSSHEIEPRVWRTMITKLARTPLPRLLTDTGKLGAEVGDAEDTGAVWKLPVPTRDLDANVIALRPGEQITEHDGPEVDVLLHVLAGDGVLTTETGQVDLQPGALVWLPRRSRRGITAGPGGLRHLSVHRKRQALLLEPPGRTSADQQQPTV